MNKGVQQRASLSPLVSIIVPAYNVGAYLESCIVSIRVQSYSNLEILIVNDGSTDLTLSSAELLASSDDRIRVINQSNQGVSAARNAGIRAARGEFVVFVDGDDQLSPDFVDYMLHLVRETGAQFCLSRNCYLSPEEVDTTQDQVEVMTSDEAIALLLSPDVIVGCWNKIYSRSFIQKCGLTFSSKLFYGEGLDFIVRAARFSSVIGVGQRKVYFYRKNNLHSATTEFSIERLRNGEMAISGLLSVIPPKMSKSVRAVEEHKALFALSAVVSLTNAGVVSDHREDYVKWLTCVRRTAISRAFDFNTKASVRAKLAVCALSPRMMAWLVRMRRNGQFRRSIK